MGLYIQLNTISRVDGESQDRHTRNRPDSTSTHDAVVYIHVEDLQIDNKLSQSQRPDVDIRLGDPRLRKLRLFRLPRCRGFLSDIPT